MNYEETSTKLGLRILALIPSNPSILTMERPFALFKVPGFRCDDLQPSLAQAQHALTWARGKWKTQSEALLVSALPSLERLEELRKAWALQHIGDPEMVALLDAALVLRRAEAWIKADRMHYVRDIDNDGDEIVVRLIGSHPGEPQGIGPDLLSALRAALDAAEGKACARAKLTGEDEVAGLKPAPGTTREKVAGGSRAARPEQDAQAKAPAGPSSPAPADARAEMIERVKEKLRAWGVCISPEACADFARSEVERATAELRAELSEVLGTASAALAWCEDGRGHTYNGQAMRAVSELFVQFGREKEEGRSMRESIQALKAERDALRGASRSAWLIERKNAAAWWCGSGCFGPWSTPEFAVRFSRREDAEAVVRALALTDCYVTEHLWLPAACEEEHEQPEATVTRGVAPRAQAATPELRSASPAASPAPAAEIEPPTCPGRPCAFSLGHPGLHSFELTPEIARAMNASPAPAAAREADVFEAFSTWTDNRDCMWIEAHARDWFGPLVEALDRIANEDTIHPERLASAALSALRARAGGGA